MNDNTEALPPLHERLQVVAETLHMQPMSTAELVALLNEARAALAAAPSAQAEPVAPFLFVAMDDEKRAHLTWCADEAAVREAVKGAMFWLPDGEELDADHAEQLSGSVAELLDSGALTFEGDAPLYLFRVGSAAQAEPQEPLTDEQIENACAQIFLSDHGGKGTMSYDRAIARAIEAAHGIGKQEGTTP